jgi:hypothetical protein
MEVPEVDVKVHKNGVFLKFPIAFMLSRFGAKLPDVVKLTCGGREVVAKLYMAYRDAVLYRVYSRYVPTVLDSDECVVANT